MDKNIENHGNNSANSEKKKLEEIEINFNWQEQLLKWQRQWKPALGIFLLTIFLSLIGASLLKKSYQAQGKLLFKIARTNALTGVGEDVGELKALTNNQTPLMTEIELIKSNPLLQETIDRLHLENSTERLLTPKDLRDNLKLKIIGGTDVVEISYSSSNPSTAVDVVNTLINVYLDRKIDSNRSEVKVAREFIAKELPGIENKVDLAENELLKFKQGNNVLVIEKEAESIVTQVANLDSQITLLEAQLRGIEAQTATLRVQLGLTYSEALAVNRLSDSPAIEAILGQIKKVEKDLADRQEILLDTHPEVVNLKEQKNLLDRRLQTEIGRVSGQQAKVLQGLLQVKSIKENLLEQFIARETQRINLSRQLNALYRAKANYQKRVKLLPELERQQQFLSRKINSAKNIYETLLNNFQEVKVTENQETVSARAIEPARFPERGSAPRLPFMMVGSILGLLLAQLTVSILDSKDRNLRTISELKEFFIYSVLGIVPLLEKTNELNQEQVIVIKEPEAFNSEIYRMIQVNLRLLNLESKPQVILVTSSVPEEGKSTISANLAAAIAESKRRVLLIDGDLRNPSQPKLWATGERNGLSDVLSGKTPLNRAIFSPIDKLDLLLAGKTQVSPLALIDSIPMVNLLERLRKEYDTILIDAPPLLVTADVLTLGKMADGILFVSRLGIVDREIAQTARETLDRSGQRVLGLVVNGVDRAEFDRYHYYAKKYYGAGNYRSKQTFSTQRKTKGN
ncbi:MAG: GumC family protein [Xenococcaceae cyanobacterium]